MSDRDPTAYGWNSTLRRGAGLARGTKGMKQVSEKRRKRMAKARRWKKGECEIAHLLDGIDAWEGHRAAYEGRDDLWAIRDRHHVYGQPAAWDVGWNVVIVSRVAHEFEDNTWGTAGQVVCMRRLLERGDLKTPEFYIGTIGFNPFASVEECVNNGSFAHEPKLLTYSSELLAAFVQPLPAVTYHGPETTC